jgi:hypothetical protein
MITKTGIVRIMGALVLVAAAKPASAQNLVFNGSFESPTLSASPWYYRGAPDNWVQFGGGVDVTHNGYEPAFTAQAQQGVQFLDMNQAAGSIGGVYQDVTVSKDTTYRLSLYAASWRADAYGTLTYRLIDPTTSTELATNTFTINSTETGTDGTAWSLLTLSATATSGTLRVQIEQFASSTAGLAVDNVALVAVPEPAMVTSVFGVVALGFVGSVHRRRARGTAVLA